MNIAPTTLYFIHTCVCVWPENICLHYMCVNGELQYNRERERECEETPHRLSVEDPHLVNEIIFLVYGLWSLCQSIGETIYMFILCRPQKIIYIYICQVGWNFEKGDKWMTPL